VPLRFTIANVGAAKRYDFMLCELLLAFHLAAAAVAVCGESAGTDCFQASGGLVEMKALA